MKLLNWIYIQGDLELESGRTPVPIMNRSFDEQQPLHQVDLPQLERKIVIYIIVCLLFLYARCCFKYVDKDQ